jgi:hypothetical protein
MELPQVKQDPRLSFIVVDILNGRYASVLNHPLVRERIGPEAVARAKTELTASIRKLVDQWIDSGKSGTGNITDTPEDRTLGRIPQGYEQALLDTLLEWLGRNTPRIALMSDGTVSVYENHPDMNALGPELWARETAIFWFQKLMESSWQYRLARCSNDSCRKYFLYQRTPQGTIKNGTYCEGCAGTASLRRTQVGRDKYKQELVGLAADFWPKWKPRLGNQSVWVAGKINERLASRGKSIGRNGKWVSQNLTAILAEVERRRHAKS